MTGTDDKQGSPDALTFLNSAGDEELRCFLRRLPIFAGHERGKITLTDLIYEIKLVPFVMDAWRNTEGEMGIPGRLLQFSKIYKKAEAEMERLTGARRRLPRVIDVPSFMDEYSKVGMP